jgi:hypothetical protein
MANNSADQQYEIDRLTAQYVEDYQAGRSPRVEDYIQRYPQYAAELIDFVLYYHTVVETLPDPEPQPSAALSPEAQSVLARIHETLSSSAASPITSLTERARELGLQPRQLAADLGISTGVLGMLNARAIIAQSLPRTLIDRLAQSLRVAPDAILAFFNLTGAAQAGGFFFADRPPDQRQDTFVDAVLQSNMTDEQKREWSEIVSRENAGS